MTNYHNDDANAEMQSDLQNDGGYDEAANPDAHGNDFLQHPDDGEQDEDDVDDIGEDADDDGELYPENETVDAGASGHSSGNALEASSATRLPSTMSNSKNAPPAKQQQTGGDLQQRKVVINNNLVPGGAPHLGQGDEHNLSGEVAAGDASGSIFEQTGEEDDPNQYGEQELLDYDEEDDENPEYAGVPGDDGESLANMRSRIREMEEEADKLREMQTVADKRLASKPAADPATMTTDEKMEIDARSVYVGNVDYGATAEELEKHFHACGNVVRVTILCDKFTGYPKGFAYIEFGEKEAVDTALALDESMFRGRQIKVSSKRTNQPGISTSDRGRGRGGMGRGGRPSRRPFRGGFGGGPAFASRSRGFSHGYNPYGRARPRGRRPTRFFYRGAV